MSAHIVEGYSKAKKYTNGVVVILLALCLCLTFVLVGCSSSEQASSSSSSESATSPQEGQAPYKSDEEMQEELDRQVEEGMLDISIQSIIDFEDGTSEGTANIENVPGNIYDMIVTIQNEDTEETYYESELLKPNQFIEKIKLNQDLDAGSYPCIATFTAYNQETGEEEGQAAAKITIEVAN